MTVFGFTSGEFTMEATPGTPVGYWSDGDDFPVSARNYAHELFAYSDDLEETPENILDELNDYFGEGEWHIEAGFDNPNGGYCWNYAVANVPVRVFPFIITRRVVLVHKYLGPNGWTETGYPVPDPTKWDELQAGYQPRKVYQDCD